MQLQTKISSAFIEIDCLFRGNSLAPKLRLTRSTLAVSYNTTRLFHDFVDNAKSRCIIFLYP